MITYSFQRFLLPTEPRNSILHVSTSGVGLVKRVAYFVLVVLALEISGVVGVCTLRATCVNDCCCPSRPQSCAPNLSPSGNGCSLCSVRHDDSFAPTPADHESGRIQAQASQIGLFAFVPPVTSREGAWRAVSQPVSPPLTPLLQSCLLLV